MASVQNGETNWTTQQWLTEFGELDALARRLLEISISNSMLLVNGLWSRPPSSTIIDPRYPYSPLIQTLQRSTLPSVADRSSTLMMGDSETDRIAKSVSAIYGPSPPECLPGMRCDQLTPSDQQWTQTMKLTTSPPLASPILWRYGGAPPIVFGPPSDWIPSSIQGPISSWTSSTIPHSDVKTNDGSWIPRTVADAREHELFQRYQTDPQVTHWDASSGRPISFRYDMALGPYPVDPSQVIQVVDRSSATTNPLVLPSSSSTATNNRNNWQWSFASNGLPTSASIPTNLPTNPLPFQWDAQRAQRL